MHDRIGSRLSTQTNFWQQMGPDMNLTFEQLNNAQSTQLVGLAIGCALFTPLTKKYGRRPTYLLATAVMAATQWWTTFIVTAAELHLTQLLCGLAGATNEVIVQMTVSYCVNFFKHLPGTARDDLPRVADCYAFKDSRHLLPPPEGYC